MILFADLVATSLCVFTYIHALLIDKNICECQNVLISNFLATAGPSQGLSKDNLSLLLNLKPHTPSLYFLPKVHKPNNSGRLIVTSFSSSTERVSVYINAHLQPIVKSSPPYIKDTNYFLQIILSLPMPLSPNTIMATVDVTSLYTNIPPPMVSLPWKRRRDKSFFDRPWGGPAVVRKLDRSAGPSV